MKIKRSEFLFLSSYTCLFISLFIGDVYSLNGFETFVRSLRLFSYVLILASCINLKISKQELIWLCIIFMTTVFYATSTGDFYWSVLVLLIYNSKSINIKDIFNLSVKILVVGICIVVVCCVIGVLPDVLTSRNTVSKINYNRHSFGFYHSNVLPLLLFYLEVYYVCIVGNKLKNYVIVLFAILALIVSTFCHSRNAVILSILLSIFLFVKKKYKKQKQGMIYKVALLIIPCMSLFSIAMMFLLQKGGIWDIIDTFFSGRFRLGIFKVRRIGIHLINIMSEDEFIKDNVIYVNNEILNTVILDNGYLYVALRYGILILLFYVLVAYLCAKKNKDNTYVLGALTMVFIGNFVDNDLVDYSFLPFILWAFNDIKVSDFAMRIRNQVENIYEGG